jgi:hypothetical protein
VALQALLQHWAGHHQVRQVDHDDRDRCQHREDLRLADVEHQDRFRDHADHHGGHDGRLRLGIHPRQLLAEGQGVVARHGEGQADGRGMHRERAHGDGDHDADQEDLAERAPHHLLDDVLQATVAAADLWIVQIGRRHDGEYENCATDDERGEDGAQNRPRRRAPRLVRLLTEGARGVEAVHDISGGERGDQEIAQVAPALVRAVAVDGEEDLRTPPVVERQEDRDETGGDQLDEYARAVDHGHPAHAERIDDGREHDQDRAENHRVAGEIVGAGAVADDLEAAPQTRQVELQRQHHG